MVFFTSILIVTILYFLQADGLIYVTVIALVAELINILLTHTVAKSVEKKLTIRHKRSIQGYLKRIKANTKEVKALEKIQEDAGRKLYKANSRIKELEKQLKDISGDPPPRIPEQEAAENEKKDEPETKAAQPVSPMEAAQDHLPDGSKR